MNDKSKPDSNITQDKPVNKKSDFLIDALHIFVLFGFALAQPLFDLMSQYAAFFVARKSEPIDIILLIFILCLVLPGIGVLFELLATVFGRRFRKAFHWFMVATLSVVIVLQVLNKIFEFPGILLIIMASVLGVAATIAYVRLRPARIFLTVLSPAILIFPGLFLFNSPVQRVVFPEKDPSAIEIKIDRPAPIIMVVFDEFPVTSLMDEDGKIDPIRYPNFASLARDAYWFRNTKAVYATTLHEVPAILSGSYPGPSRMPTAAEYPHTLFTLLGSSYEMNVFETHTTLCPEKICGDAQRAKGLSQRMASMLTDVSIVYLHLILPGNFAAKLPNVNRVWKDFLGEPTKASPVKKLDTDVKAPKKPSYKDRPGLFMEFVKSIKTSDKPTLNFIHIVLPHIPWSYLPSGKTYGKTRIPGLNLKMNTDTWGDDEWLVIQGYQRHLLQVGLVDSLLGRLLSRLKALDLYDRSLIVIAADHGCNFMAGKSRRGVLEENPRGVLGIPLLIKAPYQRKGVISDHKGRTIDILPTMADILGISIPWPVDGLSLINPPKGIASELIYPKEYQWRKKGSSIASEIGQKHMERTKKDSTLAYNLSSLSEGSETIIGQNGESFPVKRKNWMGHLSNVEVGKESVMFEGWAADVNNLQLVDTIVVFSNGKYVFSGVTTIDRPDVSEHIKDPGLLRTGFKFTIPLSILDVTTNSEVRFFALSRKGSQLTDNNTTSKHHGRGSRFNDQDDALKRQVAIFGSGRNRDGIFKIGPSSELVGKDLSELTLLGGSEVAFKLSQPQLYEDVDPESTFIPARIDGVLVSPEPLKEKLDLAVAVNGTIRAVTRSYSLKDGVQEFSAIVPEVSFRKGRNNIEAFIISKVEGQPILRYARGRTGTTYALSRSSKGTSEVITSSKSKSVMPVVLNEFNGDLASARIENKNAIFSGWAADVKNSQVVEAVVVFNNGKFIFSGVTEIDRPDVVKHFKNSELLRTGFKFKIPLSVLNVRAGSEVRLFAVSKKGIASELIYPKEYMWRKGDSGASDVSGSNERPQQTRSKKPDRNDAKSDTNRNAISPEKLFTLTNLKKNYNPYGYVAHALGSIEGRIITNSKEAFESSYKKGFRIFEVDLVLLKDGTVLAAHDQMEKRMYNLNKVFSETTVDELSGKSCFGKYTILTGQELLHLVSKFKDAYLITDTKAIPFLASWSHVDIVRRLTDIAKRQFPSVLDRIIPHIAGQKDLSELRKIYPFKNYMVALYRSHITNEKW